MWRGKPCNTPDSSPAKTIFFMARPSRQIVRPAALPASAKVFNRATFDAKVVATTMPLEDAISSDNGTPRVDSDRPGSGENTFVLSHISALIGRSAAIASKAASSQASPTMGLRSSLKSPECTMRPAGVSMTKAALSGIEWLTGTNCTSNGPAVITSGRGLTVRMASRAKPASSIFIRPKVAVKARA